MIYVGTSGWQYDSWKERFYPADLPKSRWLEYHSARFPTVEVNNSFYRLPSADAFARWRRESAPGYIVTVKASRFLTHIKRLKDPVEPVKMFWDRAVHLGDKLGPVLFQLPPKFRADLERLETFIAALPGDIRAAFEFRDPSWEVEEVYEVLDRAGAALVLPDRPSADVKTVVTGGWSYIRFHQGNPTGPWYPPEKLLAWAKRIAAMDAKDVYVYFNNDPEGAAIHDAQVLADALARERDDVAEVRTRA